MTNLNANLNANLDSNIHQVQLNIYREAEPIDESVDLDEPFMGFLPLRVLANILEQLRIHNYFPNRTQTLEWSVLRLRDVADRYDFLDEEGRKALLVGIRQASSSAVVFAQDAPDLPEGPERQAAMKRRLEQVNKTLSLFSDLLQDRPKMDTFLNFLDGFGGTILAAASRVYLEQDRNRFEQLERAQAVSPPTYQPYEPVGAIPINPSVPPPSGRIRLATNQRYFPQLVKGKTLVLNGHVMVQALTAQELEEYVEKGYVYPMFRVLQSDNPRFPMGAIVLCAYPHYGGAMEQVFLRESEIAAVIEDADKAKAALGILKQELSDLRDVPFEQGK